jgi:anti-sigma B factor antagonist
LTTSVHSVGQHTVISVGGEVDVYTAPTLREAILEQTSAGNNHLVVDLSGVEFLDSTGLGVLVGALKRIRDNDGTLVLAAAPERILKVFRVTGLTKVFTVVDTVEEVTGAVPA